VTTTDQDLPEFREMGIAAVRLLQGVLYADDQSAWDALLANESELTDYFARIGLVLIVDHGDEMAYLRQIEDDQRSHGYDRLPRLFRRTPLSFDATLLCVVLRDEYRRFEDEDLENERCVIDADMLFAIWKSFFPAAEDEVKLRKKMGTVLKRLEDLKFVRRFQESPEVWEIRLLLKARLPLSHLETLRDSLRESIEEAKST